MAHSGMSFCVFSFLPFSVTIGTKAVRIMDYNAQVGGRIRTARELRGLSRERFAELCDISVRHLADVELGKKSPTAGILHKICTASNLSADYIVSGITPDGTVDERYTAIFSMLMTVDPKHMQCCTDMLALMVNKFSSMRDSNSTL